MRLAVFFRLRLQNTDLYLTPILSLNLVQRPGGSQTLLTTPTGLTLEPATDDVVLVGNDTSLLEGIANSQQNDAAYIKFDGIGAGPERTIHHHATVDYLFAVEGYREGFSAGDNRLE